MSPASTPSVAVLPHDGNLRHDAGSGLTRQVGPRPRPRPWSTVPPRTLAAAGSIDEHQVLAYDLAHAAAAVATGRAMLGLRRQGRRRGRRWPARSSPTRSPIWPPSCSAAKRDWGVERRRARRARVAFVSTYRDPAFLAALAADDRARATSTPTSSWCRTRSGASPRTRSARSPSTSTATTTTSPRRSSPAWPRWAGSACRCPAEYGGYCEGGESEYLGMVVATEELSRGSLGVGGSLITRPEILDPRAAGRAAPRSRSRRGCRRWPPPRSWPRSP